MPNSIDPAVFEDDFDDSAHLVYGGNRIWMTELNPNSGMQIEENWWEENDPTYHFLAKGMTNQRGLKLDGAIGQGEICNSLKVKIFHF